MRERKEWGVAHAVKKAGEKSREILMQHRWRCMGPATSHACESRATPVRAQYYVVRPDVTPLSTYSQQKRRFYIRRDMEQQLVS